MTSEKTSLADLKALPFPTLTETLGPDMKGTLQIGGEELTILSVDTGPTPVPWAEYLNRFLPPRVVIRESTAPPDADGQKADPLAHYTCVMCGAALYGRGIIGWLLGGDSFTWGLAHGEGYCRGSRRADGRERCGYPARLYHYVNLSNGQRQRVSLCVQYHPDGLGENNEED